MKVYARDLWGEEMRKTNAVLLRGAPLKTDAEYM